MTTLTEAQLKDWQHNGCLHIPDFIKNTTQLVQWTEELIDLPETSGKWMKYFETATDQSNPRMLCRIENFLDYHDGWKSIILSKEIFSILEQLLDEPAVLFKEKINLKLPSGNGFKAHQDAPAFAAFEQHFHITAMISIDPSTKQNGCLEMAYGEHTNGLLEMDEDKTLSQQTIDKLKWETLPTKPGDLVLFDSYIPHRSSGNNSKSARRAAYITYNAASIGSKRDEYYRNKREVFPPEVERIPGKDYSNSGMYNIGNPIRK